MNLKDNLKKIRKEYNLSQEELADKLGVSRQSVSKWESGGAYPEMDKVLQICKIFNLNIDELLNQDIKEVTESKQSKNNINKYIDDFLSYITKVIDMFSSMSFKEKTKCIIEEIMTIMVLWIIALIIGTIGEWLVNSIFSFLPNRVYQVIYLIFQDIYIILALILGLILIFHIFKTRYLDYYTIVKDENKILEDIDQKELSKKERFILKKTPEKIIIRDPEHTGYRFISGLLKCLLWVIKFFSICIAIDFCLTLILLSICLVVSFMFVKTGLMFLGILLIILSCITINLVILHVLYNFITSKKSKKKPLFISFTISLIILGTGLGLCLTESTKFNIKTDTSIKEENLISMEEDLVIHYYHDIDYKEADLTDIKIVTEHSKFYTTNFKKSNDDNILYICNDQLDKAIMEEIRTGIEDINKKEIINYSEVKITIYASKENIEKLKSNYNRWLND